MIDIIQTSQIIALQNGQGMIVVYSVNFACADSNQDAAKIEIGSLEVEPVKRIRAKA